MNRIESDTGPRADVGNRAAADRASCVYRFGAFTLDEQRSELRERGRCIAVQPKILDVLVYLIRHHDRVVTRSELLDGLWDVVTVVDGALTTAICEARRAIGDRHSIQWAIKTVPRRGYRFIAEIEAVAELVEAPHSPAGVVPDREDSEPGLAIEIARLESALRAARSRATPRLCGARII